MPFSRLALLLWGTVFLAVGQTEIAAADDRSRATVQSIAVTSAQVTIHLSAAAVYTQAALPKDARHGRADRCYVDVSGVLGQQAQRRYAGDAHNIQQVRVAQFQPQTVRVVLDLLTAQPCQVTQAVNPDRLQIRVGRSTPPANTADARSLPAEPPLQVFRQLPRPEPQPAPVAQPEPTAEPQTAGVPEYLDLRTPFSSETQPAQAISLFDPQTPEGTPSPLSLLDQHTPKGAIPQSRLFSRQAIDAKALQLAPRGLYLLQENSQESGSADTGRLGW